MFKANITNRLIEGLNNKIKSIKKQHLDIQILTINFRKLILIQAGIISISTYFFNTIMRFSNNRKENF
ncbi:transposase [Fusobacterium nucleatum]|nr:transposase [Fusobacterium nucleatum]